MKTKSLDMTLLCTRLKKSQGGGDKGRGELKRLFSIANEGAV